MRIFYRWLTTWLRSINATPVVANQSQQGSIVIPMVGVLFVGLVLLGSVHLGYMFYMKRELQNAADTAAMSGARALIGNKVKHCEAGINAATDNAKLNLSPFGYSEDEITVSCGFWDPENNPGPHHFAGPNGDEINAIRVEIAGMQSPIMPFMKDTPISAESIAQAEFKDHIAAFSVGPQLARLDNGILTGLLTTVGLDVKGTTLADYRGLANVKITPAGLLKHLGIEVPADITVGDLEGLLNANLGVKALFIDVIEASIAAATEDGLLKAEQLDLLKAIQLGLAPLDLHLDLLGDSLKEALFVFLSTKDSPNNEGKKAGLDAAVSVGNIVDVMLGVANGKHAVALEKNIDLGILRVESKASVIESPGIAIGGIGTQAHSANIRVFLRLCLDLGGCKELNNQDSDGIKSILGNLLTLKLDLPIVLELVNGTGRIENMCYAQDSAGRDKIDISVRTETAGICIGDFRLSAGEDSPHYPFSGKMSCTQKVKPDGNNINPNFKRDLIDIKLLGLSLLSLTDATVIPALTSSSTHTFAFHPNISQLGPDTPNPNTKMLPDNGNPLSLGDTVKQLTDSVLTLLIGNTLKGNSSSSYLPPSLNQIKLNEELVNTLWEEKKTETMASFDCDPNLPWTGQDCRKKIYKAAESEIKGSIGGLQGFLGNLLGPVLGLLGDLLTLNILGVLGNVLNLLDGVLSALLGGGCYIDGLLAGLINPGTELGCKINLNQLLLTTSPDSPPNALLVLLGMIIDTLAGPLNLIGEEILNPLLNALGVKIGQVETTVLDLDCQPNIRLVY